MKRGGSSANYQYRCQEHAARRARMKEANAIGAGRSARIHCASFMDRKWLTTSHRHALMNGLCPFPDFLYSTLTPAPGCLDPAEDDLSMALWLQRRNGRRVARSRGMARRIKLPVPRIRLPVPVEQTPCSFPANPCSLLP